jgi:hypothetical protein
MFLSITLFALLVPFQNQPPVGMILMSDSAVQIQRGTSRTPARLGDLLYAGDRVITGTGQATFLFCPTNEKLTAKTGVTVELGPTAATAPNSSALTHVAAKCALPQVALGAESLERVGGMRARGDPTVVLYLGGTISSARPTFTWAPLAGTREYRLSLTDAYGAPVWEFRGQATTVSYPDSSPALKDGLYRWNVYAEADGRTSGPQNAPLRIKVHTELSNTVSNSDPAAMLLRATELENAGYPAEAAAYFRALRDLNPDDRRLTRRLVVLYRSAGLMTAMEEELNRLGPD